MKSMSLSKKIVLILICLMPFAQGLYFYFELFFLGILTTIGLWWLITKEVEIKIGKAQVIFFGGSTLLSFLTIFYGIDWGMSTFGALKWLTYLLVSIFLYNIVDKTFQEQVLCGFSFSMLLMSLLGIISYSTGLLADVFLQNGRLGGLIQYPNTFGLMVVVGMMIVFTRSFQKSMKVAYGFVSVVALFMTMSRGVLIILLMALLLTYFHQSKKDRWATILGSGFGAVVGFIAVKFISGDISSRLAQGINSSEFQSRILYYLDSINIIKDYPMGLGHLGYYFIQKTYQTGATYGIKFIHNSLLQMVLDMGVAGGILFIGYMAYQIFVNKDISRWILLVILVHSLVEFDLQFGLVWVVVILLTVSRQQSEDDLRLILRDQFIWAKRSIIIVIGLLYISATFVTFLQYTNHNALAISLFPAYTIAKIDILNEEVGVGENLDIAEDLMVSQPFHVKGFVYARDYYFANKDYDKALEYANMCMDKEPMRMSHVEIYSQILLALAYQHKEASDDEMAILMLEEIFDIPYMLEIRRLTLARNFEIKHRVDFEMTDSLSVDYSQAELLYKTILSQ